MSATRVGLYDLLAAEFPLGVRLPPEADRYLSAAGVDELRAVQDGDAVVYSGRVSFVGAAGAEPIREHRGPSGTVFRWDDLALDFRLTIPRAGASAVRDAAQQRRTDGDSSFDDLFNDLGAAPPTAPSDYPGLRFRLELLLPGLTFHLGPSWLPGRVGTDYRVEVDPDARDRDVRFELGKVVLQFEQDSDLTRSPSFKVKSWGNSGFDAPSDLRAGEVGRMIPSLAVHESGRWGFAVDEILLDFSEDSTPPEILAHFGTDEAFEGIYLKDIRLFYSDESKDFGFGVDVNDLLISFAGEVSLEAEVDFLGAANTFHVRTSGFGVLDVTFGSAEPGHPAHDEVLVGGSVTLLNSGVVRAVARGGTPPYTFSVRLDGEELWDATRREAPISPGATLRPPGANPHQLVIRVEDYTPAPNTNTFTQTLSLTLRAAQAPESDPSGTATTRAPALGDLPAAVYVEDAANPALPPGYSVGHESRGGVVEAIVVRGAPDATVTVGGTARAPDVDGRVLFDVPENTGAMAIRVDFPTRPSTAGPRYVLPFTVDLPPHPDGDRAACDPNLASVQAYLAAPGPAGDGRFSASGGGAGLRDWMTANVTGGARVQVYGYASYEPNITVDYNRQLSCRRMQVALGIIDDPSKVSAQEARGDDLGPDPPRTANRRGSDGDRRVDIILVSTPFAGATFNATISRGPRTIPAPPPTTPQVRPPPRAEPTANGKPPFFKRLSFRIRIERNVLVLGEISGQVDFETPTEAKLRAAAPGNAANRLQLIQQTGASADPNPADGVTDFRLTIAYDTSTHFITETLALGAAPNDIDGLLQLRRGADTDVAGNRFKDIFGALLIFTPVINSAAASLDPNSAGDWAVVGVSLAVPVAIGALDIFQTQKATLYGGELHFRELVPPGETARLTDFGVIFDYGVEFKLEIALLGVHSQRPIKVRYKAVGFNLHFEGGTTYQPIFDTSRGYSIDLSDPSVLNLPSPIGDVLKVLSARIARFNPLTFEVELGLKVNLGVISVDSFRVKVPIDPPGAPSIIPTGVRVDLPNVVAGSGYLNILDGGFEGAIDITILPVKIRVAASLAVEGVTDAAGRRATAVYAGLAVEFPTPIVLGATGVGIFGFAGLFAMHFKRLEDPRAPGESVSPALKWLKKAGGQPQRLVTPAGEHLWGPEIDRWSFGVGTVLGTLEGGFLVNFRGTFVLELPGPRLLVFVKIQIIQQRPKMQDGGLDVGILGVIDIDFNLGQITVGVVIDLTVQNIVSIQIPVEIFFDLHDASRWHLDIGTLDAPASALVLNLVRARGYFMLHGDQIPNFPKGDTTITLPGVAVATGVAASIVLGDEGIGLYLRVAARADLGIAFSPFFIAGTIRLSGELRLFIISIEAHGLLSAEAPDPTIIHGEICGRVDFFFFSVEGCVGFTVGSGTHVLPAPALARGVWLQSHAPVITAGQGGDRPIDASLGDAVMLTSAGTLPPGAQVPSVPIDTLPVIQLHASPRLDSGLLTFTDAIPASPRLTAGGWVDVGGGRQVRYLLKKVELFDGPVTGAPVSFPAPKPPATWRTEKPPGSPGADTAIDLALFSREPASGARALERSTDVDTRVRSRWSDLCDEPAPPACVLWTFCGEPFGPSGRGWTLDGVAQSDPPGTWRNGPVPTSLYVEEPPSDPALDLTDLAAADAGLPFVIPARVIGLNAPRAKNGADVPTGLDPLCQRALQLPTTGQRKTEGGLKASPKVAKASKELETRWITLHTGAAREVKLFLAIDRRLRAARKVQIRQLDSNGTVLRTSALDTLPLAPVTGTTGGLPPEWVSPASPWAHDVVPVAALLASPAFADLDRLVLTLAPRPECTQVQVVVANPQSRVPPPAAIVGAVQVCSQAEVDRAQEAQGIRDGQVATVTGYLGGGSSVALFSPDKTYTLRLTYDADSKAEDGTVTTESSLAEQFQWKTDAHAPARLDPWVLGTAPDGEEQYHFTLDPVKIVFNDLSVVQLFSAYGKSLRATLHGADGVPIAASGIAALDPVVGTLSTPYLEALRALVAAGLLPCAGSLVATFYGSFTAGFPLAPLMAYTLDVDVTPPDPVVPNQPVTPLFRRTFHTSRFAGLAELAAPVRSQLVRHRHLASPISGLPAGTPVALATDVEIESALRTAGEQALPGATRSGVSVYWVRRLGATAFSPHALLIDAVEPLWRSRSEPVLETVPDQPPPADPAFKRVVPQRVPALELVEQGGATIARFVRSPSGTRTLALFGPAFTPPATGTTVRLALHRLSSSLYGISEQTEPLVEVRVEATAPWEADHA